MLLRVKSKLKSKIDIVEYAYLLRPKPPRLRPKLDLPLPELLPLPTLLPELLPKPPPPTLLLELRLLKDLCDLVGWLKLLLLLPLDDMYDDVVGLNVVYVRVRV